MGKRLRFLIIDDDMGDQILIQKAIRKNGMDVDIETASTGTMGIAKANALNPDVVVLDSAMPGMDGFEACRTIKAMKSDIKIIICTGSIDGGVPDKAKAVGADGCCLKTSDYLGLIQMLQS